MQRTEIVGGLHKYFCPVPPYDDRFFKVKLGFVTRDTTAISNPSKEHNVEKSLKIPDFIFQHSIVILFWPKFYFEILAKFT